MTPQLAEGSVFPANHRLERKLGETDSTASWLTTNELTGERYVVKVFAKELASDWTSISTRLQSQKGLLHQNINACVDAGIAEGVHYSLEPYIPDTKPWSEADIDWGTIQQLLDALSYAHNLGFTHGRLHPSNLMVDASGSLHITPPGLPGDLPHTWSSPEQSAGQSPDTTDDLFALGALLFNHLTASDWQDQQNADRPLPPALKPLVENMLSENGFERAIPLNEVREQLRTHFESASNVISSVSFNRTTDEEIDAPIQAIEIGTRQAEGIPVSWVAGGIGVLIVFALLLFALLPASDPNPVTPPSIDITAAPQQARQPEAVPSLPEITPFEAAQLEFMREEGETLAKEILRLQLAMEDQGALLWASDAMSDISDSLDAAEETYRNGQYDDALDQYKAVIEQLNLLQDRVPDVLAEQIQIGDEALVNGDHEAALTAFTIAKAIDGSDQSIKNKLVRAESLESVVFLTKEGEMLERESNLEASLAKFSEANSLDGQWQPAKAGIDRLRVAIQQRNFQRAMSRAFTAIDSRDYSGARQAFTAAADILPSSTEPADGLLQVDQAERNDAILDHRQAAESAVNTEAWQTAIDEYQAALGISENLEFALSGLSYAESRLALDQRIDSFLQDPTLLQSDEELGLARSSLRDASRIETASRDLQEKVDALALLISQARIAVPVTIESDGRTTVTVRKHAILGKITSQVVSLVPGRYTITGVRSGYRDVREELIIVPGRPVPVVQIASTERVGR